MTEKRIRVTVSGEDAENAYVKLPGHPDEAQFGCVARTIFLDDVITDFKGPRIYLNFNTEGLLIGIEILA